MDVHRTDQMKREASEMGGLYLLVVLLVLAGAILLHLAPRTQATVRVETRIHELGPN